MIFVLYCRRNKVKYNIIRTETADICIRKIILYIAQNFGKDVALKKLDAMEESILVLADNPYIGNDPIYPLLRRKGYKVLVIEKNLVFYKINEKDRTIIIYAVVDQRQDYLNIIMGL